MDVCLSECEGAPMLFVEFSPLYRFMDGDWQCVSFMFKEDRLWNVSFFTTDMTRGAAQSCYDKVKAVLERNHGDFRKETPADRLDDEIEYNDGKTSLKLAAGKDNVFLTFEACRLPKQEGNGRQKMRAPRVAGIQEIRLGEPFPDKRYAVPGDHTTPILTPDSFQILQSLTHLTRGEIRAFSEATIEVYLFPYKCIPYLVFHYGGMFRSEIAININKLRADYIDVWLSSEEETVEAFLLEGTTTCVQAVRTFRFPFMARMKEILKGQRGMPSGTIDRTIMEGRSIFSVDAMVRRAEASATIPKPGIDL